MKVLTVEQTRQADISTIKNENITSLKLMERASATFFYAVKKYLSKDKTVLVFAGPGNNGGDAAAVARYLANAGFKTKLYFTYTSTSKKSEDLQYNIDLFHNLTKTNQFASFHSISNIENIPAIQNEDQIIDGLFGYGLNKIIDGIYGHLIDEINKSSHIYSIDIPSGLFGEDNTQNNFAHVVKAKRTFTFQTPKLAMFFHENHIYTGIWEVLDIKLDQSFIDDYPNKIFFLEPNDIQLKQRSIFDHKGNFGHGILIAGSYGKMGAALLAAKAALRSGIGLLTIHAPKSSNTIVQTSIPEAMFVPDDEEMHISNCTLSSKYTSIAIGPGIGTHQKTKSCITKILNDITDPILLDADAINIIAEDKILLNKIPANSILTPHPKEFDRLFGTHKTAYERFCTQKMVSKKHKVIIVLKGHYTSITCPDGDIFFNSTGNAGMATAGSGDVLSGIILSFISQGYTPKISAINAVYIHGLAGDIACKKNGSESLIASDIISNLHEAFHRIHSENM